jgi:glyoxalase family protein
MGKQTVGIHHITAIVGNPKENVAFYQEVLGLRLIKKTVNFDDPGTYHLYFGNEQGQPGTVITFFPWKDARKGQIGTGQVGTTAYLVNEGALDFWEERLNTFQVATERTTRFGEESLVFEDPHGLKLEIVARQGGSENTWKSDEIPSKYAVKGFAGATLLTSEPTETAHLIGELFGLEKVDEDDQFIRFKSTGEIGNIIDIDKTENVTGQFGVGTVHHIAFRAKDDEDQIEWQTHMFDNDYPTTEVKDRNYFNAIYLRDRGGIVVEIATDPPGFTADEPLESLGEELKLPEWLEPKRQYLEEVLPPLD